MQHSNTPNKMWSVLFIFVFFTFLLGWWGFDVYSVRRGLHLSNSEEIYRTLQLFAFDTDAEGPLPLQLEFARWIALFLTSFAAIQGVLSLVHAQGKSLIQHQQLGEGHAIICGLSRKGVHLAKGLLLEGLEQGYKVVVIDNDATRPELKELDALGAICKTGNALDTDVLDAVKAKSAKFFFATTESDSTNINIIAKLKEVANTDRHEDSGPVLECFAHVSDHVTKSIFYDAELFSKSYHGFNAQIFNIYDRGARRLFEKYAPDKYRPITSKDAQPVSIYVFGFSPLANSLILHVSHNAHYANNTYTNHTINKRVIITLVEKNAKEHINSMKLMKPALENIVDLRAYDCAIDKITNDNLNSLFKKCKEDAPDTPDGIYICSNTDILAFSLAKRLSLYIKHLSKIFPPIVIGLTQIDDMADLLYKENTYDGNISVFPLITETSNVDLLAGRRFEEIARRIHENYCKEQTLKDEKKEINPSLVPWEELDEGMKDSNRGQADHLYIKLRAIGIDLCDPELDLNQFSFTDDNVELLAEMEHARWVAGKLLDSWTDTAKATDKKDITLKKTPLLSHFDDLPEEEKEKDRYMVKRIEVLINDPKVIDELKTSCE